MENENMLSPVQDKARKPYAQPEIIQELQLETRAGSPLGDIDPLDPLAP